MGGAAVHYDQKVICCGGALAFSEPEKSPKQIKDIVELAYDHGAKMIVTPCPLRQANVNKRYGSKFNLPVLNDSQLIKASKLVAFAAKK